MKRSRLTAADWLIAAACGTALLLGYYARPLFDLIIPTW